MTHNLTPFHFGRNVDPHAGPQNPWNWFHTLLEHAPQVKQAFQENESPASGIWIGRSPVLLCGPKEICQFSAKMAAEWSWRAFRICPIVLDCSCREGLCPESDRSRCQVAHGISSTKNNNSRCGGGCRCRRRNDFARTEFQFSSQPRDAGARVEGDSAARFPSECAGAPHTSPPLGIGLLSAEQSRLSASISRPHSARRRVVCKRNEAARLVRRVALFSENRGRENRSAPCASGTRFNRWRDSCRNNLSEPFAANGIDPRAVRGAQQ